MIFNTLIFTSLLQLLICNVHSSGLRMDSYVRDGRSRLTASVEDKKHLKEHTDPNVDVDKLTIQEIRFRYFKAHDTNRDNRLDGIEVIQAILHHHDEGGSTSPPDYVYKDDELEMYVDPIFEHGDANNDGFLDYTEFMALQALGSAV